MTLSERIERAAAQCPGRMAYDIGRGPTCGQTVTHPAHAIVRPTGTRSGMIESPFVRRARENRLPAKELGR